MAKYFEKRSELIRHDFSDADQAELGKQVSERYQKLSEIEKEKSQIASEYGATIKRLNLEIGSIARKIHDGYEMRRQDCYAVFDFKNRRVIYFIKDEIDAIDLSDFDLQDFAELIEKNVDQNGNIQTQELVDHLEFHSIQPVKDRPMRNDEFHRQGEFFDEEQTEEKTEEQTAMPDAEGIVGDSEDSQETSGGEDQDRDNQGLHDLLNKVIDGPPSLKTIEGYSDYEYTQVLSWAMQIQMTGDPEGMAKPAFLPKKSKIKKS